MASEQPQTEQTPRGREAVIEALIVAATSLFAERGTQGASVREVATAAGVNHALVFRHFGSKQRLARAVLDRLLDDLVAGFRETGVDPSALAAFGEALARREPLWKLITRAVLDGEIDFLTGRSFPEIAEVLSAVERAGRAGLVKRPIDARMLLLIVLCGGVGWILLDPILAGTVRTPGATPARRRELARAAFAELLGVLPEGSTTLSQDETDAARIDRAAREPDVRSGRPTTPAAKPSGPARPPRGREQVSEALVEAAMALFAERGAEAVSVREVASRAGVNHALVFRHFGSKDGLEQGVWERVVGDLAGRVVGGGNYREVVDLTEAVAESETTWKLVARAILDGRAQAFGAHRYRFLDEMIWTTARDQERGQLGARVHPRLIVAMILAVGLGWLIFHPALLPLLGLPSRPGKQNRAELRDAIVEILEWQGEATSEGE